MQHQCDYAAQVWIEPWTNRIRLQNGNQYSNNSTLSIEDYNVSELLRPQTLSKYQKTVGSRKNVKHARSMASLP